MCSFSSAMKWHCLSVAALVTSPVKCFVCWRPEVALPSCHRRQVRLCSGTLTKGPVAALGLTSAGCQARAFSWKSSRVAVWVTDGTAGEGGTTAALQHGLLGRGNGVSPDSHQETFAV